jgi:hypothetical protein
MEAGTNNEVKPATSRPTSRALVRFLLCSYVCDGKSAADSSFITITGKVDQALRHEDVRGSEGIAPSVFISVLGQFHVPGSFILRRESALGNH